MLNFIYGMQGYGAPNKIYTYMAHCLKIQN